MKLTELFSKGLYLDPKTLHSISRDDPFSQVVKEILFDTHPTLRNPKLNTRKYNKGGLLRIEKPAELEGFEASDIKEYISVRVSRNVSGEGLAC